MPRQRIWRLVELGNAIVTLMLLASGQTGFTFRPGHMYDLGARHLPTGAPTPAPAAELRPPTWLSVVVMLIILATRVYRAIGVILHDHSAANYSCEQSACSLSSCLSTSC